MGIYYQLTLFDFCSASVPYLVCWIMFVNIRSCYNDTPTSTTYDSKHFPKMLMIVIHNKKIAWFFILPWRGDIIWDVIYYLGERIYWTQCINYDAMAYKDYMISQTKWTHVSNIITYGLPWITIFGNLCSDSSMILTHECITCENHWRLTPLLAKNRYSWHPIYQSICL